MSARPVFRFLGDRRGSGALEAALVTPVAFLLLFAIVQFGWAMHCASSARYALEQAARAYSVDRTMTAARLQTDIRARLSRIGDPDVTVAAAERVVGGVTMVDATLTYRHTIETPLLPAYPIEWRSRVSVPKAL